MYQRREEFLASRHATYETITHPAAVTAQEQAAVMHAPGQRVAKVLIVKERDGFVMAIVPAATDLDLDRLKGLIGVLYGLRAFLDRRLLRVPEVTVPAGDPASAIRMRWSEFERLAEARPGDFAVPQSMVAAGGVVRPRRRHGRAASTPRQTQEESPMTARDLMTSNPATVTPRTTIAEAWDLMRELDVRHLPVVEGEALVGMLSDRDLGNLDVTRLLTEAGADTLRRQLSRPVVQLMSTDVVAVADGV
jgi:CBS domain-containing protein